MQRSQPQVASRLQLVLVGAIAALPAFTEELERPLLDRPFRLCGRAGAVAAKVCLVPLRHRELELALLGLMVDESLRPAPPRAPAGPAALVASSRSVADGGLRVGGAGISWGRVEVPRSINRPREELADVVVWSNLSQSSFSDTAAFPSFRLVQVPCINRP